MTETPENRLKRLAMRSMRRGIKEMDILLSRYSDARLASLEPAELDTYEALLDEGDQDLYQWISGQTEPPLRFSALVSEIARTASARTDDS